MNNLRPPDMSVDMPADDLSQQFYNQPLLVDRQVATYLQNIAGTGLRRPDLDGQTLAAFHDILRGGDSKPYALRNGAAIISIRGMLEHRSHYYSSWWTGYDAIRARFDAALADPDARAIVLDIDSPGGMVSGNFDLSDHIYRARGKKPVWAMVNEHAYSAAYSLASAAEFIGVSRTGGVGSIGVVAVLANMAKRIEMDGYQVAVIRSADRKMKPNMMEPFEDEDLARIERGVMATAKIFTDTVARNRGISAEAVDATEAATFRAEEGVDLGLADAVLSVDEFFDALTTELKGSTLTGVNMTTQHQPAAGANGEPQTYTQAQLDAAVDKAVAKAAADGSVAGIADENQRIFAILDSEEAKGKGAAAQALARNPNMTLDTAKSVLAALPAAPEAASGPTDALAAAMAASGGGAGVEGAEPGIGAGSAGQQAKTINTAKIYARINGAGH